MWHTHLVLNQSQILLKISRLIICLYYQYFLKQLAREQAYLTIYLCEFMENFGGARRQSPQEE